MEDKKLNDREVACFSREKKKIPEMIVVYNSPKDYPGKIVGRVWRNGEPTISVMVCKNVKDLRKAIKKAGFNIKLDRCNEDDPVIIETWFKL